MLAPQILTAIASPRRREILRLVWQTELPAGAIHAALPDVTFGAISLQLGVLTQAGLVETRAEGRFRYYKASEEAVESLAGILEPMWTDALSRLKLAAELDESRRGPRAGAARRSRKR